MPRKLARARCHQRRNTANHGVTGIERPFARADVLAHNHPMPSAPMTASPSDLSPSTRVTPGRRPRSRSHHRGPSSLGEHRCRAGRRPPASAPPRCSPASRRRPRGRAAGACRRTRVWPAQRRRALPDGRPVRPAHGPLWPEHQPRPDPAAGPGALRRHGPRGSPGHGPRGAEAAVPAPTTTIRGMSSSIVSRPARRCRNGAVARGSTTPSVSTARWLGDRSPPESARGLPPGPRALNADVRKPGQPWGQVPVAFAEQLHRRWDGRGVESARQAAKRRHAESCCNMTRSPRAKPLKTAMMINAAP